MCFKENKENCQESVTAYRKNQAPSLSGNHTSAKYNFQIYGLRQNISFKSIRKSNFAQTYFKSISKACLGVNRRSYTEDTCLESHVTPLAIRRKVQVLRFWQNIQEKLIIRPLSRYLDTFSKARRYLSKHRRAFWKESRRYRQSSSSQTRNC